MGGSVSPSPLLRGCERHARLVSQIREVLDRSRDVPTALLREPPSRVTAACRGWLLISGGMIGVGGVVTSHFPVWLGCRVPGPVVPLDYGESSRAALSQGALALGQPAGERDRQGEDETAREAQGAVRTAAASSFPNVQ